MAHGSTVFLPLIRHGTKFDNVCVRNNLFVRRAQTVVIVVRPLAIFSCISEGYRPESARTIAPFHFPFLILTSLLPRGSQYVGG